MMTTKLDSAMRAKIRKALRRSFDAVALDVLSDVADNQRVSIEYASISRDDAVQLAIDNLHATCGDQGYLINAVGHLTDAELLEIAREEFTFARYVL